MYIFSLVVSKDDLHRLSSLFRVLTILSLE